MERKNKITAVAKETGLARTTPWNFGWFEDMDRWFDNVRRTFEDRFWGGPLARWTGSDAPVREPLVDLIDKGSEYVVRAEVPGGSKEKDAGAVALLVAELLPPSKRAHEEDEKDYHTPKRNSGAITQSGTY